MSPVQKTAAYCLTVSLATVVAYVVLLLWKGPSVAPAAMAVMALVSVVPMMFERGKSDERERYLTVRGLTFGMTAAYLFVGAVCMGIWFSRYRADEPVVDVNILPVIFMGACVVSTLIHSVVVLVLARRPLEVGS